MAGLMKKIIFISLLLFPFFVNAQLGSTKSETITKNGYNYTTGTANDGTPYITYKKEQHTDASGYYTQYTVFYFVKGICTQVCIFEPATEINAWVVYFNNRYVKTGDLTWKDYNNDVVLTAEISESDGYRRVVVTSQYDTK